MEPEWGKLSARKRKPVTYNEDDLQRSSEELDGESGHNSAEEEDMEVVETKDKDEVSVCALKRQPPQTCEQLGAVEAVRVSKVSTSIDLPAAAER